MCQEVLGVGSAFVFLANQVLDWDFDIGEPHFVHLVGAIQKDDPTHLDSKPVHIDLEKRNLFLLLGIGICPYEAEDPIGVLAERRLGLLTIHNVMVAVAHRTGFERCRIGPRARLRIALPPMFTIQDPRQVIVLLFFGPEFLQDRREHGKAKRDNPRRTRHRTFFFEDMVLNRGSFRLAEFRWPITGQPAARIQNREPMLQIVFVKLTITAHLGGKVRRDAFVQKGPHFVPKRRSSAV